MPTEITVLVENTLSHHKSLGCEHGLSLLVHTPQSTFLFDCGASGIAAGNAERLGLDIGALDFVACSHGHYDHVCGFRAVAEKSKFSRFVTGDGFFVPKYDRGALCHSFVGADFGTGLLADRGIAHEVCGDLLAVDDSCWLVGNIERTVPEETVPARFVRREGDAFVPDSFGDEICLAVRHGEGVVVVAGCSHPGVMNMVTTVRRRLGLPVVGICGGTHLADAEPMRVEATVEALKEEGVRRFWLAHCTGETMLECVRADEELEGCWLRTGDGVFFGAV